MYKAYYRKYRPLKFDEVVGQNSVVTTLLSQIQHNQVSHAYLFVGTRGTGKTTISKILARALNCIKPHQGNPCNTCENCLAALNDSFMDIVEMDAASNNGVDDIRDLRENTKFPPAQGAYKVIIIDEVHMLSKGAFNALLKTLEEPPSYVVFILATTEPNKVPVTIISRCQRYEFKRIDESAIQNHIQSILDENKVDYEAAAIEYIARLSDGGLRDALSLLEQCVSFSGNHLTLSDVTTIIGTSDNEACAKIIISLVKRDYPTLLACLREFHGAGTEPILLLRNLIEFLQQFMKGLLLQNNNPIEGVPPQLGEALKTHLNLVQTVDLITEMLGIEIKIKTSSFPWIVIESYFVRVSYTLNVEPLLPSQSVHTREDLPRNRPVVPQVTESMPKQEGKNQVSSSVIIEPKMLGTTDYDSVISKWELFLLAVKKRLVSTYALMREVKPLSYTNGTLKLFLNENLRILKHAIENEDNMNHIHEAFIEVYNAPVKVVIVDEIVDNNEHEKIIEYFKDLVDPSKITIK